MYEALTDVLARIQSDYDFYIEVQRDPRSALADHDLSEEELAVLADPVRLAGLLERDLRPRNLPSITIKISGRHDWVNRTTKKKASSAGFEVEVAAVKQAASAEERRRALSQLLERLG